MNRGLLRTEGKLRAIDKYKQFVALGGAFRSQSKPQSFSATALYKEAMSSRTAPSFAV
jgi:hypothetical protein